MAQRALWRALGHTTSAAKGEPVTGRRVQTVTVPTGRAVLDLLPVLAEALDGRGPALLPVSPDDPRSAELVRVLGAGEPLGTCEDDPADPTALVIATSGSTGTPKGVLLPAGALAASAAATEQRLGGAGNWLLALPVQHIAGMQVLLRSAAGGTEPVVSDTAEPFTAARFAAAAAAVPGPRRYASLVPTQLQRVLEDRDAAAATSEIFDAVLVGGSATPTRLLDAARAAGIAVVTTYGMTETCGGCVYDGRPLDPVTVTIDPAGPIVLSGPVVARGYRGLSHHPAFATPGSFVTADAGAIGSDGRLTVTGRLDDMIVTGGVNVPPALVERSLLALPEIAEAVVVGVPDRRWGQAVTAVVAPRRGGAEPPDLAVIRSALAALPPSYRPRRLVVIADIPLLASGKPDRVAALRLALAAEPA